MRRDVPLAPLTTLGLGGRARYYVEARDAEALAAALAWAREEGVPAVLLGGGSNVVVADAGVDGLVVRMAQRGVERAADPEGRSERWTVAAGEPWDPLVERAVAVGLVGIECLSGIPGSAGATPIQNVGAYGQEVSEVIESVRVLDRDSLEERELSPEECGFGYRDSRFRREPERFAVLSATFRLERGGEPALRYPELARAVAEAGGGRPTLESVRRTVLALRRSKSMVIEAGDENRRSVGSFFVNPVLLAAEAEAVVERAVTAGAARDPSEVPRFAAGPEPGRLDPSAGPAEASPPKVKLSAGWLIERAGFAKGTRRGPVGISSRHALALVHHGGGTTAELLALAREVRRAVQDRFGVTLRPEPVFLGFGAGDPLAGAG